MAGRYKPYAKYKDSNIEWIGSVPEHWKTSYLGFECSVKARLGWKGLKAEEYVDDGYIFLATPNIKDNEIDFNNVNRITKERYDESPEIILKQGDVLVTKDGSTTGTTNIIKVLPEPATVNSSIAVLRSRGNVLSEYLYYFFVSEHTQNVISRMRGGMGVPHLFQADLRKFDILIPTKKEQNLIADFLNHEIAKIDTLIEKQKLLIQLLKEKRQAVVKHAITKGLNASAKMRDSGVVWLGEIPEHWVRCSLKHYARVIDCKHITAEFYDDGIPLASIGEVKEWNVNLQSAKLTSEKYYFDLIDGGRKPQPGDIIYSRNATVGEAALVADGMPNFAMGQDVCLIRLNSDVLPEFILHVLKSSLIGQQLDLAMVGSTFKRINVDNIRNFSLVLPPVEEQAEIIEIINRTLSKYKDLVSKAKVIIELMQERRTAIISAAVTGKIDVRNWVASQASQSNKEVAA